MPRWREVHVAAAAEDLAAALAEIAGGVELRETAGEALIVAFVAPGDDATLARLAAIAGRWGTVARPGPVRDESEWREAWVRHVRARRVGPFLIRPSWDRVAPEDGDLVLDIDPGQAFGSGGHASTRLCLRALAAFARGGTAPARVLDAGTGSGILALAAARLFPRAEVVATDVDPQAVAVAQANAEAAGLASRLRIGSWAVRELGRFDVALANLTAPTLIELAGDLAAAVLPAGGLIASGLLVEQAPEVSAAFGRAGLRVVAGHDEEEWRALVARGGEGGPAARRA